MRRLIDRFSLVVVAIACAMAIVGYFWLPTTIATHFSGAGKPDAYGSKRSVLLDPLFVIGMYAFLTFALRFARGSKHMRVALSIVKLLTLCIFTWIEWAMIQSAEGTVPPAFVPVIVLLSVALLAVLVVSAARERNALENE